MRGPCRVCGGVGTINVPMPAGTVMCYCGPNGEPWPQELCPNCAGQKYIGTPDVEPRIPGGGRNSVLFVSPEFDSGMEIKDGYLGEDFLARREEHREQMRRRSQTEGL